MSMGVGRRSEKLEAEGDRHTMDIQETTLPGVGLRHDFTTRAGRQLGVVTHRTGRRDLLVYDREDPDACQEVVQLTDDEADALAELLGAARLVEHLARLQQVEGLAIDWLPIRPDSPYAGRTIADTQARTRTGVSIVAILRGDGAIPAPTPDARLEPGDTLVVVGTTQGVKELSKLLGS
jgi:TrkA domain protein